MENKQQQPDFSGFDFNKIPKVMIIRAAIALFGTIMVMLPWFKLRHVWGWGHVGFSTGFSSPLGVLAFLTFLGIAVINVLGEQVFKFKKDLVEKLNLYGSIGVLALCFIDLLRFIAIARYIPSFGVVMATLTGVALLLFALKVIKIK